MDWTQHLSPKQPRKWLCVFLSMSSGRTETEEPISGSRSARRRLLPVNLSPCPSQRSICYISVSAACWYIVTLKPTWIFIVSHLSCVTVGPLVLVDKMVLQANRKSFFLSLIWTVLWARCVSPTANESSPSHFAEMDPEMWTCVFMPVFGKNFLLACSVMIYVRRLHLCHWLSAHVHTLDS